MAASKKTVEEVVTALGRWQVEWQVGNEETLALLQ